jgi:hypothetical protein
MAAGAPIGFGATLIVAGLIAGRCGLWRSRTVSVAQVEVAG